MCLIIHRPENRFFDYAHIEEAAMTNNDGIGVMFVHEGRVRTHKRMLTKPADYGKFYRDFDGVRDLSVHLRYATHGNVDTAMCHPFRILRKGEYLGNGKRCDRDLFMMHNGILDVPTRLKTHSDSWHFARDFLRPMLMSNPDLLMMPAFQEMLNSHTRGNRLLFLDSDNNTVIINADEGEWFDDVWLSNDYYIPSLFGYGAWQKQYGFATNAASTQGATCGTTGVSRLFYDTKDQTVKADPGRMLLPYESSPYDEEFEERDDDNIIEFRSRHGDVVVPQEMIDWEDGFAGIDTKGRLLKWSNDVNGYVVDVDGMKPTKAAGGADE